GRKKNSFCIPSWHGLRFYSIPSAAPTHDLPKALDSLVRDPTVRCRQIRTSGTGRDSQDKVTLTWLARKGLDGFAVSVRSGCRCRQPEEDSSHRAIHRSSRDRAKAKAALSVRRIVLPAPRSSLVARRSRLGEVLVRL